MPRQVKKMSPAKIGALLSRVTEQQIARQAEMNRKREATFVSLEVAQQVELYRRKWRILSGY
jgi:hypothetical protein